MNELRALLDASPWAVVDIDPDDRVTAWNRAAEELFGWRADEVLGRPLPTVPPDRRQEFEHVIQRQRRGESVARYETQRLRKDGTLVDVAVWSRPRFDDDGGFLGTVAFVADLAETTQVAARLREHEQELRTLVETSPLVITTVDAEGNIRLWNTAAEELFGWKAQEVIGKPIPHVPERLLVEYEEIRRRQLAGEPIEGWETRRLRRDGSEVDVAIWSATQFDAAGSYVGIVAYLADISERKRAEGRLRREQHRLAALQRVTGALAAATTSDDVARVMAEQGAGALGAAAAWIGLLDERRESLRIAAVHGYGPLTAETFGVVPLSAELPVTDAMRLRAPLWFDSTADYRERYPDAPDVPTGLEAFAVLPLAHGNRVLGAAAFQFEQAEPIPLDARTLMETFAAQCAQALERARLFDEVRAAEARLTDANRLLRAVADGMTDALAVKDADGVYLLANDADARLLGYDNAQDVIGKRDADVSPANVAAVIRQDDRLVLETGEAHTFERTFDLPSGRRTFITSKSPLRDAGGDVIGVIAANTDITARKRMEDELRTVHEALSLAQRAASAGVWEWRPEVGPVYWSPEYRELYGFVPSVQPDRELWLSRVHPDDRERLIAALAELFESGTDWEVEFRVLHPTRGVRWVEGRGRVERDAVGKAIRFSGIAIDVTNRKRAEQRLRQLHQLVAELGLVTSREAMAQSIAAAARAALSADFAVLAVLGDDRETVLPLAAHGAPAGTVPLLEPYRVDLGLPSNEAIRTGVPVTCSGRAELEARWPEAAERYEAAGIVASAAVPVAAEASVMGALTVGFASDHAVDDEDLEFLTTLAREGAVALDRAGLFEREREARTRAERERERTERLQRSVARLAGALREQEVAEIALGEALSALAGKAGGVALLSSDAQLLEFVALAGVPEHDGIGEPIPVDAPSALATAFRTGLAVAVESRAELEQRYALGAARFGGRFQSQLSVPLMVGGAAVGAFSVLFGEERQFAEDEIALLVAFAGQAAQALDRARLFERELDARRSAERDRARIERLERSVERLTGAVREEDVSAVVLEEALSALGAAAGAVALLSEDRSRLELTAVGGLDPRDPLARSIPVDAASPLAEAYRNGRTVLVPSVEELKSRFPDAVFAGRMRAQVAVPLVTAGRTIGGFAVVFEEDRRLSPDEVELVLAFAGQAAQALERARLFEREHTVAETLQRSLLPSRLPAIAGFSLAARYVPGGAGLAVGGDWYDALELPTGVIALVVGDVVGHGLEAAAAMGQLRNAVRVQLLAGKRPAEALAGVNELVALTRVGDMATLCCALLEPATGAVTYTTAGHPPPLLIRPGGDTTFLAGARSLPLGATGYARFDEETAVIEPGATLLLYTDGLIERRREPIDHGLERLRAAAASRAELEVDDLVGALVGSMLEPDAPSDDVALLALRVAPVGTRRLALELPAEPAALATLRRSLGRYLAGLGVEADDAFAITVAVGEAAANAVEHAYGPAESTFSVEAIADEKEVCFTVHDRGRWRAPRGTGRGRGLALMEALTGSVEVSHSDEGTEVRLVCPLPGAVAHR